MLTFLSNSSYLASIISHHTWHKTTHLKYKEDTLSRFVRISALIWDLLYQDLNTTMILILSFLSSTDLTCFMVLVMCDWYPLLWWYWHLKHPYWKWKYSEKAYPLLIFWYWICIMVIIHWNLMVLLSMRSHKEGSLYYHFGTFDACVVILP